LKGPEVGAITSARLRMLPEVFGLTSGGFSEVVYGVVGGEFSVVAIFTRRFCGAFGSSTPEDPQNRKALPGLYRRQPPGLLASHLRSLRDFEDQDLEPCLIDCGIARN